jgi:hypothetical protein
MPQAIKHYTGQLTSGSNTSVYTCPASTIAIVMPSIHIGPTGSGTTTFSWNSSSNVGSSTGNLSFTAMDSQISYLISCTDKYDVQIPVRPDTTSYVHYSPYYTSNITQYYAAFKQLTNTSAQNNAQAYGMHAPRTNSTSGTDGYWMLKNFHTGPWVMSAGHKFGVYTTGAYVHWNLLILEEAA